MVILPMENHQWPHCYCAMQCYDITVKKTIILSAALINIEDTEVLLL